MHVCWSENEVCSGTLLAHCNFDELKIDCAIDQLKPGLKSMVQYIYFFAMRFRPGVIKLDPGGILQSLAPTCLNTPACKFQVYLVNP